MSVSMDKDRMETKKICPKLFNENTITTTNKKKQLPKNAKQKEKTNQRVNTM